MGGVAFSYHADEAILLFGIRDAASQFNVVPLYDKTAVTCKVKYHLT